MGSVTKSIPLFPTARRKTIVSITVRRFEDGRWVRAPEPLSGDALLDRKTVQERFGGGRYEIVGRDGRQIVARTRFVVPGTPRPFTRIDAPPTSSSAAAARPHATSQGEREALVFSLLDDGLDLVQITERTGIEAKTVRAIFAEWMTPLGDPLAIVARRRELADSHRRALEAEATTARAPAATSRAATRGAR